MTYKTADNQVLKVDHLIHIPFRVAHVKHEELRKSSICSENVNMGSTVKIMNEKNSHERGLAYNFAFLVDNDYIRSLNRP